jgi:predicted aldo/keto reductase-like oxidoreductase
MERLKEVSKLYCTSCKYCAPCPEGIDIPAVFSLLIAYNVYGLKNNAQSNYSNYGKWPWLPKVKADACTECGTCEPKCPQKIPIREQLKKAHSLLSGV